MSSIPGPPQTPRPATSPVARRLDLLIALGHGKRLIAGWTLAAALVSLVVSLLLPRTFTGITRILPPQQGQSTAAAMLGQLGGLAGMAGGSLGLKNPSDLFIGMLRSQTVADALIERFKLKVLWDAEYHADARRKLAADSRFQSDKGGLITIEVEAREPQLAADLANAYVEELHKLTSTLAVTDAAQRRVFFERQLQQTREKLSEAELRLRQGIQAGGLVSVDAQGRAAVETVARLRAQISAKEIQIGSMKGYATPTHPDLQRAEGELASMRQELSRLESGGPGDTAEAGGAKGIGNIRLMREVKYNEVMFELLAKQYEMARVDEAKEAPIVQVMDRAAPPERKSGPKRALIVIAATLTAFFSAVLAVLVRNAWRTAGEDAVMRDQLEALRAAWSRRAR